MAKKDKYHLEGRLTEYLFVIPWEVLFRAKNAYSLQKKHLELSGSIMQRTIVPFWENVLNHVDTGIRCRFAFFKKNLAKSGSHYFAKKMGVTKGYPPNQLPLQSGYLTLQVNNTKAKDSSNATWCRKRHSICRIYFLLFDGRDVLCF